MLLSLLTNAPILPILVRWTGLAEVPPVKARSRAKAVRALIRYTKAAIHDLQHDEDEMLRGVLPSSISFKVVNLYSCSRDWPGWHLPYV